MAIYSGINRTSSLSLKEHVGIIAGFHAPSDKTQNVKSRGYTPEQLAQMKQAMKKSNAVTTLGIDFTRPMHELKEPNFEFIASIYTQWDRFGTLPFSGALTEQPNQIIEALFLLQALKHEQMERQQQKKSR